MASPDSGERASSPRGEWHPEPIPTELRQAVTENALSLADLLRQFSGAQTAEEHAFEAMVGHDERRWAAGREAWEKATEDKDTLSERIGDTLNAGIEAASALESFFRSIEIPEGAEGELRRRECATATYAGGLCAVVVTGVTDLHKIYDSEVSVAPYLTVLGHGRTSAQNAVKRLSAVAGATETVLEGVALDDAARVKEELVRLGCKAQVVEERPRSTAGGRQPIPESVRHEVWRRDGGACVDCGSRERLEFDHIIPISKGGSNTARNIELRCESCNRRKSATI